MKASTLKSKVAIISGSSMGIGKAIAIELAKQGASVVLNGTAAVKLIRTEKELLDMGLDVISVVADVRSPSQCQHLVGEALNAYGKIDILINNAGVSSRGSVEDMASSNFKILMETNFLGGAYLSKYAIPHLRKTRGHLIFINSVGGFRGMPYNSAYTASKMAQAALADSLRIELYDAGIHVGLAYVGFTENDSKKTILDIDGSWVYLPKRTTGPLDKQQSVAKNVCYMIETKTKQITLTPLGYLTAFLTRYFPSLASWILRQNRERIRKEFTYIGGEMVRDPNKQRCLEVKPIIH